MRKSRLNAAKQARLMEHFVAGTTARCGAALGGVNRKTAAGRVRLIESVSKVRGIGAVKPLADAIRPERQIGSV